MPSIARVMREKRRRLGISLRALAGFMGISAQYLHDLERGFRPMNPELHGRHAQALIQAAKKPSARLAS